MIQYFCNKKDLTGFENLSGLITNDLCDYRSSCEKGEFQIACF